MSAFIPSIFNRMDFWAMLLPGYFAIILILALFSPTSFIAAKDISSDLFSVVLFIAACPTIGFTMSQAITLFAFLTFYRNKYSFLLAYSHLRAICKEEIRQELDAIEARTNFSKSTGVVLIIINLILICQHMFFSVENFNPLFNESKLILRYFVGFMIFGVGITLVLGSVMENKKVRVELVCKLLKEYGIDVLSKYCKEKQND